MEVYNINMVASSHSNFRQRLRKTIFRGIGANLIAQIIFSVLQLLLIPIFLSHWGASHYGVWVTLFTLPAYITLLDFGFAITVSNDMTLATARGDTLAASRTFQNQRLGILALSFLVVVACILFQAYFDLARLEYFVGVDRINSTIFFLVLYGAAALNGSAVLSGYRCAGLYTHGVIAMTIVIALESGAAATVVMLGGHTAACAMSYFIIRAGAVPLMQLFLFRNAAWLSSNVFDGDIRELKRLIPTALSSAALPIGVTITLQGTILAAAYSLTSSQVAMVAVVRTMVRLGFQLASAVNNAVMPEFTLAVGRNEAGMANRLFLSSIVGVVALLAASGAFFSLTGAWLVTRWTVNAIEAPSLFILALAFVNTIHGTWFSMSNLLLAINRHTDYAYLYPGLAFCSVVLAVALIKAIGIYGIIPGSLALEIIMLLIVWRQCRHTIQIRFADFVSEAKNRITAQIANWDNART